VQVNKRACTLYENLVPITWQSPSSVGSISGFKRGELCMFSDNDIVDDGW